MSEEKEQSGAPDFNHLEEEVLKVWDEERIFEKSLSQTQDKEPFVFYDGPPFATGLPHHGHILGSTVKDVFGRYQTMKGRFVRRVWGWDCHGLPIENIVEKALKISGKKQIESMGVEEFNAACRKQVLEYADEWGKMVRRMGRWVDFENSYKTMDTAYQESVWWGIKQFWDKGLVYEDRKVLLYCSRCETPISNFEVAMDNSYKDVTESSVFVKFQLLPRQRILDWLTDEHTFMLAWTTTPWTLPANTALNVGREIEYVVVTPKDAEGKTAPKYILAKDRLSILEGEYDTVLECTARSLEGLAYEPLYQADLPQGHNGLSGTERKVHRVYGEDFVTTEDGTGVVHNAVMYGEDDFKAGKARGLPYLEVLDHKGEFLATAPEFLRGKFFKDADSEVLADLQARGLVFRVMSYTHSYPHCHRCATPLFYSALPAWFINIQKIKPLLLEKNQDISWYPGHLKDGRFAKSVESAPDWNISRNRYWATALPFWKCDEDACGQVVCVGSVAELIEKAQNFFEVYPDVAEWSSKLQIDATLKLTAKELERLDLHKPYIDQVKLNCDKCRGSMTRVKEVVDCWVESGSMPFAEVHAPFENQELFQKRMPADFVCEYIAQTRAWFYLMHVVGVGIFSKAPFRNVVTTGNVLAEDGAKMSKSLKNYPDPWLIISKYGIDALRFYLVSTPVMNGDDLNFSERGVKEIHQKFNMLFYNVWQFYKMCSKTAGDSAPVTGEMVQTKNVLDVWILEKTKQLTVEVTRALDVYNTPTACRLVLEFISDLSTWYVRRSRERMKRSDQEGKLAVQTLGFALVRLAVLSAPLAPFLSEAVYRDLTGKESVHLENWPEDGIGTVAWDQKTLEQMDLVREVCSLGLALRKSEALTVRQPLRSVGFLLREGAARLSVDHYEVILEELNIKQVGEAEAMKEQADRGRAVKFIEGQGRVRSVYIDTELDDALKQEGQVRELERAVQDLRKKAGLRPGELVKLYFNTTDENLAKLLQEKLDKVKTSLETVAQELEVEVDEEVQAVVGGSPVWLGIVKAR